MIQPRHWQIHEKASRHPREMADRFVWGLAEIVPSERDPITAEAGGSESTPECRRRRFLSRPHGRATTLSRIEHCQTGEGESPWTRQ
jgi:hypothetical protein